MSDTSFSSYQCLQNIVNTISPVSNQAFDKLYQLITFESVAKGCFIQHGDANQNEYFILEGVVRTYVERKDGSDITLSFYRSNSILAPFKTRTTNSRSRVFVEAITPTKLANLDAHDFFLLQASDPELRKFAINVLEKELMEKTDKEILMASYPAKERLKHLREKYSGLENEIPLSYIASYLGITLVSFSRLRASETKNFD